MSMDGPVILLVEDDENDVFFMRRALTKAEIDFPVHVTVNGQDALDYLGGAGKFADRAQYPLPSLVFLDLKLPFVGGLDVLAWIRSQASLKELPVVILTSSAEDRDRQRAAELGAKAYFVKPPTPEMVKEAMKFLDERSANTPVSA
jgi:CheY-like chemotaxis protein